MVSYVDKINKEPYVILFAADSGYLSHLATAIYSLLKNNQSLKLKIFIISSGFEKAEKIKLNEICKRFDVEIIFKKIDDRYFDGLVLNHHFKKSNYYRLFASELLSSQEVCLYLDADIIVDGSIKKIFEYDLKDYYLAAVENPGFSRHEELGMNSGSKYFNSGVMLINLEKWRKNKVKDAVVSLVRKRPEVIQFVDQCGLNSIINGNWLDLGFEFNCQSSIVEGGKFNDLINSKRPVIVHFTGSDKPWMLNNKHPYKKQYWAYRNKTPYRSFLSDDFSLSLFARSLTPKFIKKILRKLTDYLAK